MQMQISKLRNIAILMGMGAVSFLATPVGAVDILDDPIQIEERLTQVIQTSNSLCWEMYRYHQQQPDYRDSYQSAKDIWSQATQLREAVLAGPVETEMLVQRVAEMNDAFLRIEKSLTKWGTGDRTSVSDNSTINKSPTLRTVVTPGVGVNIPFLNVQVGGGSQVEVVEDPQPQPQLQRRRLHPNSHGSKRSLEREFISVKLALSYLTEDSRMQIPPGSPTGNDPTSTTQDPQPPRPDSTLEEPGTVVPARKQDNTPERKPN